MSAHRALPLDVVEARQRAARVSWGMTCPACNTGTPGNCDCMPAEAASSESGIEAEAPYVPPRRPAPPPYPWRGLGAMFLTMFAVLGAAHALGAFNAPAAQVAAK